MIENAMHELVITNQSKPNPKNFTKTPKISPKKGRKPRFECMKCMSKERNSGFRAHTKELKLGMGRKLNGQRDLQNKRCLDQVRREKDRDI